MNRLQASRTTVLIVFMLSTFAIGMTEYVVTGLLTQFSMDLDVPISTTGLLLSVYALGVAVFGPILRMITIKFPAKKLLIIFMGIFVASNIIAATAPNFEMLLVSRLLSATMHAPFFGLSMAVAVNISTPEKRTAAIAAVQGGLTIAIMLGVPFGSYLGGIFDWRYVFWFIALIGVIAFIGIILTTPNHKPIDTPNLKKELGMFKNKSVLLVIAIIVFGFSGVFTAYTFKEPMLREFAGFEVTGITAALFCFGLGAVIGNFASGRVIPKLLTERLMGALVVLAVILVSFTYLLQFPITAFVACFLFGVGTFGTTPLLNSKIIIAAREAPSLSGTVAASVFNLANAIGAFLGTMILDISASYVIVTFVAAGLITLGIVLTFITHKVEDKSLYE
ncbi:MFS transporter [Alkalicoccobacillus murimartini]|uniref:MFS family arabinose efflux permease n=1 Tax=Alkalicoccobacillus murimartini TaxID=171685 RepID=A0ABT9YH73_9BACI|nr:MFS transporter [Alkalicoccobacillus murimartini]MDQ0207217.1 putative MFS family arabinose efflux permease [Alkalicoccobacillus murimartini]